MRSDSRRELVAALLWDKPALYSMKSEGARAFTLAMSREMDIQVTTEEGWSEEDSLTVAAAGLLHVVRGEPESAVALFQILAERNGLASLLGNNLLAWLSDENEAAFEQASRLVKRQRDPVFKARLWCKLAAVALDRGQRETGFNCLTAAAALVPANRYLGAQIRVVLMNEFGVFEGEFPRALDPDDLVDQPWIARAALDAARLALQEEVEAKGVKTTRVIFRYGLSVVDKITAAEMQATWAGALWLRRGIRLQLASTLLTGGARTPEQWTYACAAWVLGGGKNPASIIDMAEPHFISGSADSLLNDHLQHYGPGVRESHTYGSILGATWDLVNDDTAEELVASRLRLPGPDDPLGQEAYSVLGALALRVPQAIWMTRLSELTGPETKRLASSMAPDVIDRLSESAARRLLRELHSIQPSERGVEYFITLAALLARVRTNRGTAQGYLSDAPSEATAEILARYADMISEDTAVAAMKSLARRVRLELKEAEQGRWGFGGWSARSRLGTILGRLPDVPGKRSAVNALADVVESRRAPVEMRLEAALALWPVAKSSGLPSSRVARLRAVDTSSLAWGFEGGTGSSEEALRAAILGGLVSLPLVSEEEDELLALSRDSEPRTRKIAVAAAARVAGDETLGSILLAALYDPNEEVIVSALGAYKDDAGRATRVPRFSDRFRTLFLTGGRDLRVHLALAAMAFDVNWPSAAGFGGIVNLARGDRSWLVRDVIARNER